MKGQGLSEHTAPSDALVHVLEGEAEISIAGKPHCLRCALLVRGIRTEDIMSPTRRQVHTLTPFAKVRGTSITYPPESLPSTAKKPSAKRARLLPVENFRPTKASVSKP